MFRIIHRVEMGVESFSLLWQKMHLLHAFLLIIIGRYVVIKLNINLFIFYNLAN